MEAIIRRLKRSKRGISNVIVIMLSLVLIVIIVANVVLWSYQMNQLDWEKMQENISLLNARASTEETCAYNPSEYILGGATSWSSGDTSDLTSDDGVYMTFRSYYSGTDTYDFVDNNTSGVDSSADKGTHTFFSAQQHGPDGICDTLTEADTSVSDNNNVDSEIVTHGSTTGISNAQTADGVTENMTEGTPTFESYSEASSSSDVASLNVPMPSGTVEDDLLVAVFSKDTSLGTLSSPSGWNNICELSTGQSRLLVAYKMAGAGESGPYTFSSTDSDQMACGIARFSGVNTTNPINAQSSTQTANTNAPQCLSATTTVDNTLVLRIMGADDDDYSTPGNYPSGHTGMFTVQSTGSWGETHCAMAYVEQTSAGSTGAASFSMTANEQWGTITLAIAPSAAYQLDVEHVVNSIVNYENYNLTTRAYRTAENFYVQMYNFTSSQWVNMSTVTGLSLTWYNTSFVKANFVNSTSQARIRYWQGVDAAQETLHVDYSGVYGWNTTYELDLEAQWTNADYDETNKWLCIYGGTMASENILVDVWNGTAWQNLFIDLTNGWNNISVSSYFVSSTFTIRFKDGIETGDNIQDRWDIDVTLLHVWSDEYTSEVEFTGSSNIEYWNQLSWTVNSAWTIGSVNVTLQLYNNTLGGYPASGNGYMAYTSDGTPNADENRSQTINVNTTHFRNATGYWKMKIKGVKTTDTPFDSKVDWIEFRVAETTGVVLTFKNQSPLTSHLVSLWINNSTNHQKYDINIFINSGDTESHILNGVNLPNKPYTVKVVTERGNVAVLSSD